ncbi:MAG: hypothetical protein JSV19_10530 [Phycisphaerales bacterium]|nr:MAG: hypothetical protein JSV19_10530 [Phycisphaerales bacterium]
MSAILASGCHNSAKLHLIPLTYSRIDAKAPLVLSLQAQQCYFWVDERQQIRIAMTGQTAPLFDKESRRTFDVSLVLDGVPANVARNYRVTRRGLRGTLSQGDQHTRFASIRGIAAVWLDGPDRIHGRIRISTKHQKFSVLLGWHASRQVLVLGEFDAVRDQRRCEAILARTEQGGMERDPFEPSRPGPTHITGPPTAPPPQP